MSPRPASLRIDRPDAYVYRQAWKRGLAGALDAVGDLLLAPPPRPVDWAAVRRVAVVRLDHLGDTLFLLPALEALRRACPRARLDVFVGPWGLAPLKLWGKADALKVFEAPWFRRPVRQAWPWAAIRELAGLVRQGGYEAAFEPRGELRHLLALRLAGVPVRAGHAVTAGRFLLTHPALYQPGLHEVEQNLSLLRQAGVPAAPQAWSWPALKPSARGRAEAAGAWKALGLKGRVLAVQAASGTRAKRWMPERWAAVLDRLPRGVSAVLLGGPGEEDEMRALAARCGRKPAIATGRLSLDGLAAFLPRCAAMASVDSGPAHLAAALGVPLLALYSGTNLAAQWGPRGRRVELLRSEAACSPCELADCPFGNACMAGIPVDAVRRGLGRLLKA